MKKIVLFLLTFIMAVVGGVSYGDQPLIAPKADGAVVQMKNTAPLSSLPEGTSPSSEKVMIVFEPVENGENQELADEQSYHSEVIPLTYEEQDWLQAACEEFNVPYALALGLIEKESNFRNLIGDHGASAGYMQIQQKWHQDRMERLGVTDLLEPSGNFRVGCDFLAELCAKYNDWNVVLTVFNMGHDPGYITDYAKDVMENYVKWQEVIENYI